MIGNLLQLERLVRRLVSLLGKANAPEAGQLAQDYSKACEDANRRLQQCENILRNGDVGQALQLAESKPNLMDVVTVLAFGQLEQWRAYCEENHLADAPAIDESSVRRLNDCYGKGVKPESHLYVRYRSAILRQDEEKALEVIRSIARINPTDEAASAELSRVDARLLDQYMEQLSEALETQDELRVEDLVERIEGARFQTRPPGVIWLAAQRLRCNRLLISAEELRDQADWAATQAALANLEMIFEENDMDPREHFGGRLSDLRLLLQEREQSVQQKKNQGFRLGKLQCELDNLAASESALPNLSEAEVVELQEAFEEQIGNVSSEGIKVSPDLLNEVVRWRGVLESRIARGRSQRRTRKGLLIALGAAVIGVGIGATLLYGQVSRSLKQLAEHRKNWEYSQGSQLRKQIESSTAGRAFAFATVAEFSKWDAMLGDSVTGWHLYQTARDGFVNRVGGYAGLDEMSGLISGFNSLSNHYAALPPEYQNSESASFNHLQEGFVRLREQQTEAAHAALGVAAGELETILAQFQLDSTVLVIEKGLARMEEKAGHAKELLTMVERAFNIPVTLRHRIGASLRELERRNGYLDDYRRASAQLLSLDTLSGYQAVIGKLKELPLSGIPEVFASKVLKLGSKGSRQAMVALICGGSEQAAQYIESPPSEPFLPDFNDREADAYSLFRNNEAIGNDHNRYRFHFGDPINDFVEWLVDGTLNLTGNKIGWQTAGVFQTNNVGRTGFRFNEKQFGILGGRLYFGLEERKLVSSREFIGKATETAACYELGLHSLFDPSGSRFAQPLLKTLDQLKENETGHPLFRAYAFIQLVDLMRDRPVEWGLSFSPALHEDIGYLRRAVGSDIETGDWYRKQVSAEHRQRIENAFKGMRDASYERQAKGLLKIYHECFERGFKFVGHLSVDGKPLFLSGRTPLDRQLVWSLDKTGNPIAALRLESGIAKLLVDRLPHLSPLMIFDGHLAQTLRDAGIDGDQTEFATTLPSVLN